ncbi:glycosyltransferase family 31 protein [Aspergillus clavatus NRRL 1]|uniref:Fringe-like glycosyltransferase domain-containing protein n=1 Tax=Aspergillus clavatus (strain ATCC 1007 / CBS 513.65 / DSM 816 / NCTC 3887 / NRRL 1 / QM 1276 / 107) TaxID=344612 RepID=A1CHW2_ASPCL|nr:uncharacterized protein ACLA_049390 [Aspergillus clavatus NRRL 1]EAW10467.1 conserved hypothetical protein [Aspergillus clavatus NRRL 1]
MKNMFSKIEEKHTPVMAPSWLWKKKLLRFSIALLLVGAFSFYLWPQVGPLPVETTDVIHNITITSDVKCEPDFDLLRRLDIHKLAQYERREMIAASAAETNLPTRQRLDIPLMQQQQQHISNSHGQTLDSQSQDDCYITPPITVPVPPRPANVDASHIDFGVATTLGRLNDSLDAFAHWAGYTRTRIFALIEPAKGVEEVRAKADSLGINLLVTESGEEYQTRYFSLVAHLAKNMRSQTRWACVIDDDTFFPSITALVDALARYDDRKPQYIGGVSESLPQIGLFGLMGFGGAGVFLSRPLVTEMSDPEVIKACQEMPHTGDRRISMCIYQYTETRLTVDYRLHQLDMRGDVSGFFEAGREPPLSVHHWKSWFQADMAQLTTITNLCGDSCFLRQWQFADGWLLTNGFSIVKYSTEHDLNDRTMEVSWGGDHGAVDESYLHTLGPLRPKDTGKISYLLEDSLFNGEQVRQWFVHRDSEKGDRILELIWKNA